MSMISDDDRESLRVFVQTNFNGRTAFRFRVVVLTTSWSEVHSISTPYVGRRSLQRININPRNHFGMSCRESAAVSLRGSNSFPRQMREHDPPPWILRMLQWIWVRRWVRCPRSCVGLVQSADGQQCPHPRHVLKLPEQCSPSSFVCVAGLALHRTALHPPLPLNDSNFSSPRTALAFSLDLTAPPPCVDGLSTAWRAVWIRLFCVEAVTRNDRQMQRCLFLADCTDFPRHTLTVCSVWTSVTTEAGTGRLRPFPSNVSSRRVFYFSCKYGVV